MTLNEFFSLVPKAAVAFSGGTDSAFLLWAARECGCDVRAYYVKTAFQPQFELEDARRLASERPPSSPSLSWRTPAAWPRSWRFP